MAENIENINQEEPGIDFMALAKKIWCGRKTVLKTLAVFFVLGAISAFTMTRVYNVHSVMVPQLASKGASSSLSSLASLAGFDIGTSNMSGQELSPLVYPQIVNSVPFRLKLLYTPLHWEKADTAVSMLTYAKEYNKPGFFSYVKKYTIGLPGVILGLFKKEKPEVALPATTVADDGTLKPLKLTKDEEKMLPMIGAAVNLSVDKKEGLITLSVTGTEPLQTAELAIKAQELIQEEITKFRTQKAQEQLDYVQARYNEIKAETESYQNSLAIIKDRSQDMLTTRSRIEMERIQSKYNIANTIYGEMAKQLEQAKMQVKKDTPVLTVIQPVTVPTKPANSRAKTLIGWLFFGFVVGCGIVLGKDYLPKLKEKFKATEE